MGRVAGRLYSTLAYNRIKVKDVDIRADRTVFESYLFDAVQPSRYVLGLGYDHPDGIWGINTMFTYSKAKSVDELLGSRALLNGNANAKSSTARRTGLWYVTDVSGYYKSRNT